MQPKQIGIILGFAVLRDALVVRLMLVPILLRFAGRATGGVQRDRHPGRHPRRDTAAGDPARVGVLETACTPEWSGC
jgi:hypothetical protein